MRVFFLDTNIFLQCRDLRELPWNELVDANDVLLIVPLTVLRELEKHRRIGRRRQTNRARNALSLFKEYDPSTESRPVIRKEDPRVELSVALKTSPTHLESHGLDPDIRDDQIIGESLAYQAKHPDQHISILTDDTAMRLKSQACGLECVQVPEAWRLRPEPDERERELQALQRQVAELKRDAPDLVVEVTDLDGEPLETLEVDVVTYPDLSPEELNRLLTRFQEKHPMAEEFEGREKRHPERSLGDAFTRYVPPTEASIERYQEQDYPKWVEQVESELRGLASLLEEPSRHAGIVFTLENQGVRPAEGLIIEFEANGDIELVDHGTSKTLLKEGFPTPSLPDPPDPPRAKKVSMDFSAIAKSLRPSGPDPLLNTGFHPRPNIEGKKDQFSFYRRSETSEYRHVWECQEFRHKSEPEEFVVLVRVPRDNTPEGASIRCTVSARNLPEPTELIIPIRFSYEEGKTLAEAERLLDEIEGTESTGKREE